MSPTRHLGVAGAMGGLILDLSRLGREGALGASTPDLHGLLARAQASRERTAGAFHPAVQPLWRAAPTLNDIGAPLEWRRA